MKKNREKGSLTVEASLVLPVFLFAIVALLYFFQVMWIQEQVHFGLWECGKEISRYGYIYDRVGVTGTEPNSYKSVAEKCVSGLLTKEKMKEYLSDEVLSHSCVNGGIQYSTTAYGDENEILLCASYKIQFPLWCFASPTYQIVQQVKTRAFVGTDKIGISDNKEEDIEVYVTETGTVYHRSLQCSHINLTITTAKFGQLSKLRNQYGGKYKACEKCVKNKKLSTKATIYVPSDGDKYHNSLGCSGLTRRVRKVKLSSLMGYPPCSKCGGQ